PSFNSLPSYFIAWTTLRNGPEVSSIFPRFSSLLLSTASALVTDRSTRLGIGTVGGLTRLIEMKIFRSTFTFEPARGNCFNTVRGGYSSEYDESLTSQRKFRSPKNSSRRS